VAATAEDDVQLFEDDDQGFRDWLHNNPMGYVVNTPANISASSLVLHRADCQHIDITRGKGSRAGTGRYVKACSDKMVDLETWAGSRTGNSDLERCGTCEP
jgi:hypothetical protein